MLRPRRLRETLWTAWAHTNLHRACCPPGMLPSQKPPKPPVQSLAPAPGRHCSLSRQHCRLPRLGHRVPAPPSGACARNHAAMEVIPSASTNVQSCESANPANFRLVSENLPSPPRASVATRPLRGGTLKRSFGPRHVQLRGRIRILRHSTCIAGPEWSWIAMMPSRVLSSVPSKVTLPLSVRRTRLPSARIS